MDLRDYVRLLRRGWPIVLAFVVVGVAAGLTITLASQKIYRASVQVFVATEQNSNSTDLANGNTFTQDRVQSYTSIATSPKVTGAVLDALRLRGRLTEQQLADKISADAPLNKVLINLHVTDTDPAMAKRLANALATAFDTVVADTEQTDARGKPVVKLTPIQPATLPTSPISPNNVLDIGLGLVLGLLVGIGVVVVRNALDNTVKAPSDFEELGVPTLAMVPLDKRTQHTPIAFRGDPHSVRSEAYRQLRTNLQFVNVDSTPRIIAVTSAIPGEGKTISAMNLAAALAEAGYRVCLVEADLRRPTIAKTLDLVGDVGFTTVLLGRTKVEDALQNVGRNFAVLTSGPIPPNPSELLLSEQARSIVRDVAARVDYTIVDTAPLLPVADGAEVAAFADATLVVHRAGRTTRDQAARSITALQKVGERPVGVILNMVTRAGGRYDYEYNYYYTYRPETVRSSGDGPRPTPSPNGRPSATHDAPAQNGVGRHASAVSAPNGNGRRGRSSRKVSPTAPGSEGSTPPPS